MLGHYKKWRWAHFLKQKSLITVYRFPAKVGKLLFVGCSKQTEVCCFRFLFAANKRKLPFSVNFVSHITEVDTLR
jgi:hypothetical protein